MEERMPLLGEKFPEIIVKTTHGVLNLPEDLKGKWTVLFSHPGDFTPVCTTEFVSFAKKSGEFEKLNTRLIGLSIDQVFSHIKWVEWIKDNLDTEIPFPIIADDMGEVSKKLGMIHPGKGTNTVRAVFIIDENAVIRLIMYYPQEVGRSIDEILRSVKALQLSDKNKVAMPENWPNNPIIGDKVIIPPAADYKTAMERKNSGEGFDWWFKTKNL
ncbi:MAG: peroxiredoxin [Thermotogae bacterium]|nr:peroxiredoxin [Thermotogota bacterium]MCP5465953.1 peroxiredoxin [Thermotogota bacterium]HOO76101.1 peroxiredoxin [Tepiditoga sp.]